MAEKDIIRGMIVQPGQSRDQRNAPELDDHFVDLDERKPEDFLLLAKRFAELVNFYPNDPAAGPGDWRKFFPFKDLAEAKKTVESGGGEITPHLALLVAFLELYEKPRQVMNSFTGRHLDFYYREVLRCAEQPPRPDKAHLLVELKKNAPPVMIGPLQRFSAGKDAAGVEILYAPTAETVVNSGAVCFLRSLFIDRKGRETVRCAPIADSADGVGGELAEPDQSWSGFGHEELPAAEVGFALSAPVLRMKEGSRQVKVTMTLAGAPVLGGEQLQGAFEIFLTGEEQWLGPYLVSPVLSGSSLTFGFTVTEGEKPVVDYGAAVHGFAYAANAPVLKVVLRPELAGAGYRDFRGTTVVSAQIQVEVNGVSSFLLEGDAGALDSKKPFLPFGSQPGAGSLFRVGCREALAKKLSRLELTIVWKEVPSDMAEHYRAYDYKEISNSYFTCSIAFRDGGGWLYSNASSPLFEEDNPASPRKFLFQAGQPAARPHILSEGAKIRALHSAGGLWSRRMAERHLLARPIFASSRRETPEAKADCLTFSLNRDFLHSLYRKKHVEKELKFSKTRKGEPDLPNEPYTPAVQSMSLSYRASSGTVAVSSSRVDDYLDRQMRFFHNSYFGQLREHRYQREQFGFLAQKEVPLFPHYPHDGELLIGLSGLQPGDSVSLLFQVAPGTDDPDQEPESINWCVLCDNYWQDLDESQVVLDSTKQLLASGIIRFLIPRQATTVNSILPSGCIWIKGGVKRVAAVCRLLKVAANALEVEYKGGAELATQPISALPAKRIAWLKTPVAEVKGVKQPFASFGGRGAESAGSFRTRVSERLRHKNRCVTPWDYERIVLEAFPEVYRAKCIPHAKRGNWLSPGNVLVLVVPDLRALGPDRQNGCLRDCLQPRVDSCTIDRIIDHLQARAGMQVLVSVGNPCFQKVMLHFKVAFRRGYEANYQLGVLNRALVIKLSPWAFDSGRELSFGGTIYKSVLLNFVEELDYVDYTTEFRMYSYAGEECNFIDLNEACPETPDAILVSAPSHQLEAV